MSACADAWMTQVCCSCALSPEGRVKNMRATLICVVISEAGMLNSFHFMSQIHPTLILSLC